MLMLTKIFSLTFFQETGKMSKSLPLLIDTSKAKVLLQQHSSSIQTTSKTSSSSDQTEEPSSIQTTTEFTTKPTTITTQMPSSTNINHILPGQHQKSSSPISKLSNEAIKIEATIAIFISFLLFLVICLIFSIKRNKQKLLLNDCDKVKLINNEIIVNNSASRCSLESTEFLPRYHQQQTIHV